MLVAVFIRGSSEWNGAMTDSGTSILYIPHLTKRVCFQGMEFSAKEIDSLLLLLSERKQEIEILEAESHMDILLEFLHRSQLRKQEELHEVSASHLFQSRLQACSTSFLFDQRPRMFISGDIQDRWDYPGYRIHLSIKPLINLLIRIFLPIGSWS